MKKIAMVVLSSFPLDVRVRREAEALIEAGDQVDILCRTSRGEASNEVVNNIKVFRLNLKRKRAGKITYILEYLYFFSWASFKLSLLFFRHRYDIIHVHNMPNFLVYTATIPKLFGAKVILDLHDPLPELYATMFSIPTESFIVRFVKWLERVCIKFADLAITPNISFKKLFISRGCPPEKIKIVMNSPDEKIFKMQSDNVSSARKDKFVIMYHGAIVKRQGPDILLDAVALVKDKIPNLKVLIFGEGKFLNVVKNKIRELELSDIVELKGLVIVDRIAQEIKNIDLGIIPNRINSFTRINFPVRTFEYLVMKKPVIVPKTQGIMDYFKEGSIFFFKPGDHQDLAQTILKVYDDPVNTKVVLSKSIEVFNEYRWKYQKQKLINLTNELVNNQN